MASTHNRQGNTKTTVLRDQFVYNLIVIGNVEKKCEIIYTCIKKFNFVSILANSLLLPPSKANIWVHHLTFRC